MIVTLTANPSVDRTVRVDRLARGEVICGSESWAEPSGKGVNVTLALHAHGHATLAVLPLGGTVGIELKRLLDITGASTVIVPIERPIRGNVSLLEPDGTVTKFNEPGPELSGPEATSLFEAALAAARDAEWLACRGRPAGRRVGAVLASLGPHGALLLDENGLLFGEAPVARPVSTVGAGDALLAGGGNGAAALETALRWVPISPGPFAHRFADEKRR